MGKTIEHKSYKHRRENIWGKREHGGQEEKGRRSRVGESIETKYI